LAKPGIYLEDLFVIPEKRSKGYGTKMLKELVKIAISKNCGRVEWSVLNWNSPAIKVYEGIGANPQSEWTVYRLTESEMINFTK
jgi:GNAT superfamily N-acetyltransferase